MFRFKAAVLVACIFAPVALSYSQDITVASNVTTDQMRAWLRSDNPRLVAWGAYFASRSDDDIANEIMVESAERWGLPSASMQPHGDVPQYPQCNSYQDDLRCRLAMSEILYALIERDQPIPPEAVNAIESSFPYQAAILATRLPANIESQMLLQGWFNDGENVVWSDRNFAARRLLARVASMLLAKGPPSGFAASILAASSHSLEIIVRSEPLSAPASYLADQKEPLDKKQNMGNCRDRSLPSSTSEYWPPLFDYVVEENPISPDQNASPLVEAGDDRLMYRRVPAITRVGECFFPRPFNPENLRQLVEEMVGTDNVPWGARSNTELIWKNNEQFLHDLKSLVDSEEAKLHMTVKALYAKGYLTKEEANSIRTRLVLAVLDQRSFDLPRPLPDLTLHSPFTSYVTSLSELENNSSPK